MLKELKNVPPKDGRPRRWFFDELIDLIVWYEDGGGILGFQLCYPRDQVPHALTWQKNKGYSHEKIDDDRGSFYPQTPILVPDGMFHHKKVLDLFLESAADLEPEIKDLVVEKIKEKYGE